jgi:TolB protein
MMRSIAGCLGSWKVRTRNVLVYAALGLGLINGLAASQWPGDDGQITETQLGVSENSANEGFIVFSTDRDNPSVLGMCPDCEEIYVMNPDGSGARRLTNNKVNDNGPDWSHSKKTIAFYTNRRGLPEIWLMNPDGTDQRFLATVGLGALFPSWSPNGNQLCFNSAGRPTREIFVVNADGTGLTNVTNHPGDDLRCDWSPKGDRIAFVSNREDGDEEIYVMNADGSHPVRLTFNIGSDANPDWSPKGDRIAFECNRVIDNVNDAEICTMNADGSNLVRLTFFAGQDTNPSWSPKADQIVFQRRIAGHAQVFTMYADGSGVTPISNTPSPGFSGFPSWAKGKLRAEDDNQKDKDSEK